MSIYSPDKLRERYDRLMDRKERIVEAAAPIRDERDALAAEYEKKDSALRAQLKKEEEGLYDIDVELAIIARALGRIAPA